MKLSLILGVMIFLLAGCGTTTVPVIAKFPDAPGTMALEPCPQLQKLTDDVKLSGVATTVTANYGTYYECAVKTDAWIEWYKIQKNIFESIK